MGKLAFSLFLVTSRGSLYYLEWTNILREGIETKLSRSDGLGHNSVCQQNTRTFDESLSGRSKHLSSSAQFHLIEWSCVGNNFFPYTEISIDNLQCEAFGSPTRHPLSDQRSHVHWHTIICAVVRLRNMSIICNSLENFGGWIPFYSWNSTGNPEVSFAGGWSRRSDLIDTGFEYFKLAEKYAGHIHKSTPLVYTIVKVMIGKWIKMCNWRRSETVLKLNFWAIPISFELDRQVWVHEISQSKSEILGNVAHCVIPNICDPKILFFWILSRY